MKKYTLLMVVAVALAVVYPAIAQQTAQDIDAKLQELDAKMQEMEELKQDLEALRGELEAAPAPAKPSWADRVSINGYFQTRYTARDWPNAQDDFSLRRMYINMIIKANERTNAVISWTRIGPDPIATSSTDWCNVFVDYKLSDLWTTRIGQAPDWFGLETMQGSSARMALERARVLEAGLLADAGAPTQTPGLYFAGPWDRGIWFIRNPRGNEPQAIFGVMNGQFRGNDANTNKTVSVDLKWNRPWGQFGASWLDGEFTGAATNDRNALLGYARWDPPDTRWALQGEYVEGEIWSNDIDGWYAQAEYAGATPGGTAFLKCEEFDPDDATAGDTYDAWHLGYAQWLDQNNEVTLQYTDAEVGTAGRDEVGLQWQFGFR